VAVVYDIRNASQVVVWQRHLEDGGAEALEDRVTCPVFPYQ
jgi:hypothetical protein